MAQLLGDGGGLPLSADLIDRGVDSLSREQMIELLVTMQLKAIEQENINDPIDYKPVTEEEFNHVKSKISVAKLKQMLRRENELRVSPIVQSLFTAVEQRNDRDWMEVATDVQVFVLREAKIKEADLPAALHLLRTASVHYPDDPEFVSIPLYKKFNRNRQGPLQEGEPAPNVQLVKPDGSSCHLLDLQTRNRPLVLVAGSYT